MDTINDLLKYLPKGSISLFFNDDKSYYYDCEKTQTLNCKEGVWLKVNNTKQLEQLSPHSNDWVHIHRGDKIEVNGRQEELFTTKIQSIVVPVNLTTLIELIGKEPIEKLLTEIRDWVYSIEGKAILPTLSCDDYSTKGRPLIAEPA